MVERNQGEKAHNPNVVSTGAAIPLLTARD
jgi:hypothetical protein